MDSLSTDGLMPVSKASICHKVEIHQIDKFFYRRITSFHLV